MIRVLVVLGTRPEAVKLCPLVLQLRRQPEDFRVSVCVTAQHRAMLDQVLAAFDVIPDHDLDVMQPNQTLAQTTARIRLVTTVILFPCVEMDDAFLQRSGFIPRGTR